MQRIDHPDPAAANAQALDDLENGATGLTLVFAGSVSANGFGLDAAPAALARVLDGIELDAGIAIDLNLVRRSRHVVRDLAALVKSRGIAPAAVDLRGSINPIGGLAATGAAGAALERARAVLCRDASPTSPAKAFAGRSPSPTAASSTMPAARKRRSSLSRSPARSPICARLKRGGMALAAARDAIYFRLPPMPTSF